MRLAANFFFRIRPLGRLATYKLVRLGRGSGRLWHTSKERETANDRPYMQKRTTPNKYNIVTLGKGMDVEITCHCHRFLNLLSTSKPVSDSIKVYSR